MTCPSTALLSTPASFKTLIPRNINSESMNNLFFVFGILEAKANTVFLPKFWMNWQSFTFHPSYIIKNTNFELIVSFASRCIQVLNCGFIKYWLCSQAFWVIKSGRFLSLFGSEVSQDFICRAFYCKNVVVGRYHNKKLKGRDQIKFFKSDMYSNTSCRCNEQIQPVLRPRSLHCSKWLTFNIASCHTGNGCSQNAPERCKSCFDDLSREKVALLP